jgi:quercetin dioxygenase-like cupin family protein
MSTPPSPLAVPPGEGKRVKLFGVRFRYKVDHAASGGNLAVLEVVIPPHTLVKPHTHTREDEYTIVHEGTVGVRIGDEILEGAPGSYLVKPRDIPHAMWNAGDEPARVVEILSPAGAEKYFEELAPVLERHDPPETYYALAGKYGLTINDEWIEDLERTYHVKL